MSCMELICSRAFPGEVAITFLRKRAMEEHEGVVRAKRGSAFLSRQGAFEVTFICIHTAR